MLRFIVAAGAASLICGGVQAQSHFAFTEQLASGPLMMGTFDGTLSGDTITGLSNISVFLDGVAFQGNGSLIGMHYDADTFGYVAGGAVASLDGQHNNFLFADVDTNVADPSNYYFSLFDSENGFDTAYAQSFVGAGAWGYGPVTFQAVELAVPEPASWALMAGGFALAGAALRNRRKPAVTFG